VRIEILERLTEGTCELTRKQGIEVWAVRMRGGQITRVCTQRLPEVLRILAAVGDPKPATTSVNKEQAAAKPPS